MAGMILCLLFGFWGLGFWVLGFGEGDFGEGWDPMMMMMDWFAFTRLEVLRSVVWFRSGRKGVFLFLFISGGGYEEELCE